MNGTADFRLWTRVNSFPLSNLFSNLFSFFIDVWEPNIIFDFLLNSLAPSLVHPIPTRL